jgi:uroporphyrinogen decarboxylase
MAYQSRERVARILSHQEADRVPFDTIGFPVEHARRWCDELGMSEDERECFTEGDFRYLEFALEPDREAFAPYLSGLPEGAEISPFGVGRVALFSVDGYRAGHTYYYPLGQVNTVADLEHYPFPDVTKPECHAHLDAEVAAAKRQGFTVIGQMSQTILEMAYTMRGIDRLFLDFYERPDYVRALFEALAERRCFQARRFAQAGVDVLRIGDDIATQVGLMVGPPMYREWIKPYHARVTAAARDMNPDIQVLYHSDGALTALLPDLIEAGVTAVNPCQPEAMPPVTVKKLFGHRLTFWGCTASQSTYTTGTGDDVVDDLRMLLGDVARGGGLVVQFYNMIVMPRVLENLRKFVECFYEMASYA